MAKKVKVLRLPNRYIRAELHATKGDPPNRKPLLRFFDCRFPDQPLVCEAELGDFTGCAQWFYEAELCHNYGFKRGSAEFKRKVRKLRKALGYSYP